MPSTRYATGASRQIFIKSRPPCLLTPLFIISPVLHTNFDYSSLIWPLGSHGRPPLKLQAWRFEELRLEGSHLKLEDHHHHHFPARTYCLESLEAVLVVILAFFEALEGSSIPKTHFLHLYTHMHDFKHTCKHLRCTCTNFSAGFNDDYMIVDDLWCLE